MTALPPFLPFDPEETPVSCATRLAALHTGESVVSFLHDIGQVHENMVRVLAWRSYSYRGNAFMAEFLHGKGTKVCLLPSQRCKNLS